MSELEMSANAQRDGRPHHVWKYGRHPITDRWD